MERYKDKVKYWMTLTRSIIKVQLLFLWCSWTNSGVIYQEDEKNPVEVLQQVIHYQSVASAKVVQLGRKINKNFKIGCMLAMVPFYRIHVIQKDILDSQKAMEHRLFHHGDLHVFGERPYYIEAFCRKK